MGPSQEVLGLTQLLIIGMIFDEGLEALLGLVRKPQLHVSTGLSIEGLGCQRIAGVLSDESPVSR